MKKEEEENKKKGEVENKKKEEVSKQMGSTKASAIKIDSSPKYELEEEKKKAAGAAKIAALGLKAPQTAPVKREVEVKQSGATKIDNLSMGSSSNALAANKISSTVASSTSTSATTTSMTITSFAVSKPETSSVPALNS